MQSSKARRAVQEEASLHNLTPTVRFFRVVRARHSGPVKSDRLLSILLLLQTRARAPAGELADHHMPRHSFSVPTPEHDRRPGQTSRAGLPAVGEFKDYWRSPPHCGSGGLGLARLHPGPPRTTLEPGTDLPGSTDTLPRAAGDARDPRDHLPGSLRPRPRRTPPRTGQSLAHRTGHAPAAPPVLQASAPDVGGHGDDQRAACRGRRPRDPRSLVRRPHHRQGPQVRHRHTRGALQPLRCPGPPAQRPPARSGRLAKLLEQPVDHLCCNDPWNSPLPGRGHTCVRGVGHFSRPVTPRFRLPDQCRVQMRTAASGVQPEQRRSRR